MHGCFSGYVERFQKDKLILKNGSEAVLQVHELLAGSVLGRSSAEERGQKNLSVQSRLRVTET